MKQSSTSFLFLLFVLGLYGCASTEYVFIAEQPVELMRSESGDNAQFATISPGDTVYSRYVLNGRAGRKARKVRYKGYGGYVHPAGFRYVTSYTTQNTFFNNSRSSGYSYSSSGSSYKPVHVRSHTRTTKSGKTVTVRAHNRSLPGSGSKARSSSSSYRSSTSKPRSSGSSYRSSGSSYRKH